MKYYLIVAKGPKKGMPIPITVDLFLIGSAKVCQLRSNAKGIGVEQCSIITRGKKVFLRDWSSGNPTLLNNELVPPGEEWPVHTGDRVTVGPLEFVIQFQEKGLFGKDLEEWALKCLDVDHERESREGDGDWEFDPRQMNQRFIDASQAAATMFDRLQDMRGVIKGRLRVSHEEGITVIRFMDAFMVDPSEIALIKKEVYEHITRPNLRVLLDFKAVQRISSVAVEMLLEIYRTLRIKGSTLALCRIRPDLRSLLETLNVIQPVPHFGDKRLAMAEKW
jgi:ABC-type transporter Mla MlaB component